MERSIPVGFFERYPELQDPAVQRCVLLDEDVIPTQKGCVAEKAAGLLTGDRDRAYGDPYEESKRICGIYNAIREGSNGGWRLTPIEFEYVMLALKLSRQQNSHQRDNWVDLCGYADIACSVMEHTIAEIRSAIRVSDALDGVSGS